MDEAFATEVDAGHPPVLLRRPRLVEPVDDARPPEIAEGTEAGAGEGGGEPVLAHQLVEAVEGLVVGDQEELADLVAHRDPAAVQVRGVRILDRLAGEERMEDERRVGVDRQPGLGAQLGEPLEGGHGGEELDGARRVEILGPGPEPVLDEDGPAAGALLDEAEDGLEAEPLGRRHDLPQAGMGAQDRSQGISGR